MLREMFGAVDCDVVGDSIVVSTVTLEVLMVWCMVWSRKMFQEIGNIPTEAGAGPTMVREQMLVVAVSGDTRYDTDSTALPLPGQRKRRRSRNFLPGMCSSPPSLPPALLFYCPPLSRPLFKLSPSAQSTKHLGIFSY